MLILKTVCGVSIVLSTVSEWADVGDPTVMTNHPQYAGEGAFQTVEDCVRFATNGKQSAQDKAIAMYLWMLTHQWHLVSPQEFNVPGAVPDTRRSSEYDMMVYDANRARFSYGYGLCGTVHAWNEPYWKALGMNARRRAFPGHTNSEIEYDGAWHAFDTDMAGLIFRPDGVVAGYADVAKDAGLATAARPPLPCYPFAWPNDFNVMRDGWRAVAKGGHWYPMYHSGYAAHPAVVHLRAGESFTRYFDRDHFGGPSKRRFWHVQPGGPFRDWTFANQGTPNHKADQNNCRGNASYCNGEFVYRPNLVGPSLRAGAIAVTDNLRGGAVRPKLASHDDNPASITFGHFSPYVICADPDDDENPMTGPGTGGLVITGTAVGSVRLAISADEGQTWNTPIELTGHFERDVTDLVKGRYGWQARFELAGRAGLDELAFTTVTQVCQSIYPRLRPNGTTVTYRASSQAVVPVLPNFAMAETELGRIEDRSRRSSNVVYSPRGKNARAAYRTTNNKPGVVVFRIDSATDLTEITAAVRFGVRVPPPPNCDFRLDSSFDGGSTWLPLAKADIPADNEYSSGWMFGRRPVGVAGAKSALVRATFFNGGHPATLLEAQLYGLRRTSEPQALRVTHGWIENGTSREFHRDLRAGTRQDTFTVATGSNIVDDFIRFEAAD